MNRPTPLFVLAMATIVLTVFSVWVIATLHNHAINEQTDRLLNPPMCVNQTGHKKVPCPEGNL